jgi:hypothetical protein
MVSRSELCEGRELNWGTSGNRATVTFDGDELDHDDAETEAFVCAGLKVHLSRNGIASDVKRV